jgi:hypothetical protein
LPCVQLRQKRPNPQHAAKVNRRSSMGNNFKNAFARSDHGQVRQRWNSILL